MGNDLNHYMKRLKELWKRFWHFFWEEDTLLSWAVNIVVAFILIKWVIYPGLGLILSTDYPIVAVVSNSMEHDGLDYDQWWSRSGSWYESHNISKEEFESFDFRNGFNKGDMMVLQGVDDVEAGDVVVFWGGKKEPIIHRVVKRWVPNGQLHFMTKGDHNAKPIESFNGIDETDITKDDLVGKAFFRVPYLGYIKILFVDLLRFMNIVN
ncbi:signal peptidase I [Candidatus Woesearchaeota archaeon]|nr:signal peptidase I [Candidatus Woesearchaeota archaeon]